MITNRSPRGELPRTARFRYVSAMTARKAMVFLLLAAAGAAGGCSRTYDGSVVPTYEMATDQVAGIPYLTLKRTPLDPPNMRGVTPPPPPDLAEDTFDTAERADAPSPSPPRQARRVARRAAGGQAPRSRELRCRDEAPEARLVRMVCD